MQEKGRRQSGDRWLQQLAESNPEAWDHFHTLVGDLVRDAGRRWRLTAFGRERLRARVLDLLEAAELRRIRSVRSAKALPAYVRRVVEHEAGRVARTVREKTESDLGTREEPYRLDDAVVARLSVAGPWPFGREEASRLCERTLAPLQLEVVRLRLRGSSWAATAKRLGRTRDNVRKAWNGGLKALDRARRRRTPG